MRGELTRGELTRGKLIAACVAGAVAFGAAAWLVLGPVWVVAGALIGLLIGAIVVAVVYVLATADAVHLLSADQPDQAITQLRHEMASWRALARIWPNQFRDALASRLIVQSGALQAVHRDEEALRTAAEAVAIYHDLAAERPGKYSPDLADALDHQSRLLAADDRPAEALAATDICQDKLPWQQLPSCAPQAMLLAGELLCGQPRYREADRLLAKGWRLAEGQETLLRDAVPAIKAAHRADPDHFSAVWQAETGAEPPDWLGR